MISTLLTKLVNEKWSNWVEHLSIVLFFLSYCNLRLPHGKCLFNWFMVYICYCLNQIYFIEKTKKKKKSKIIKIFNNVITKLERLQEN
jgi:hypothetical protein